MDELLIFLVILALLVLLAGGILGIIAFFRLLSVSAALGRLRDRLESLERRGGPAAPPPPRPPVPVPPPAAEKPVPAPSAPAPPAPVLPVFTTPAVPPPAKAAPAGESFESRIGKRWMTWVGAVVVFLGAAFFLKYAFDNDWIGPNGQVTLCAIAGAAMLVAGSLCVRKRWPYLGRGLMGLGLAILYATFFAAFSLYKVPVMSQPTAFGCMVAVTVAGMALAVLHNALSTAFLAVLGGLLTPVLVSTGVDARDALFTYLLLLDVGVLAVAVFRNWRLLDALALAGTVLLYAGWYGQFGHEYPRESLSGPVGSALAWLGAFFVLFLVLPFVHNLRKRISLPIERFVMAVVNAVFAFSFAWSMLYEHHRFLLGFVALSMATAYVALGWIVRRRLPGDERSLFATVALSVTFLTLAVPLQLKTHGILLAWVAEAPVLLYLGYRFRYRPVRALAAGVLAVGIVRLIGWHWPEHEGLYRPFINSQFLTAMAVPAAMAVFAVIHQRFRSLADDADRALKLCAALGGGLLTLILAHPELSGWLRNERGTYEAACGVVVLWAIGSLAYLLAAVRARSAPTFWAGATLLLVMVTLAAITYGEDLRAKHLLVLNLRFGACLAAVAAVFVFARAFRGPAAGLSATERADAGTAFYAAGLLLLLVLLSTEAYTFCVDYVKDLTHGRRAGQMAITLVWGVSAVALLIVGFWRRLRPLRLAGLGLFGAAALKLVIVDMTHVRDVYRIVSFLALGMLMVAASYLYHKLEKRLLPPAPAAGAIGEVEA